jgi:hypothetical protein
MICPIVFTQPGHRDMLATAAQISANTLLSAYQPRSISLMHELYHVTSGENLLAF